MAEKRVPEPTEAACRAAYIDFYQRPERLSHIPVAEPDMAYWPEMRDALKRALWGDRKRVAQGQV